MPLSGRSFQEQINCPESVSLVSTLDNFQELLLRKSVGKVTSEFWDIQGSTVGISGNTDVQPRFQVCTRYDKNKTKLTCLMTDCKEIKPVNPERN